MASALLPRHPSTGLYAIGFTSRGPIWPVMGGEESDDAAAQAAAAQAASSAQAQRGFPEGTPVAEMTSEQQVAYWKHHARTHEDRNKAFGGLTPEQVAEMKAKLDKAEAEAGTETEKAVRAAYAEAEQKIKAELQPQFVAWAFRAAVGDRMPEADLSELLEDMNLNNFLTADGSVDTAKVKARAEKIAPAKGSTTRPGPSAAGNGARPVGTVSGKDAGLAEAQRRGFVKP
jgi:hypothetical protein